MQVRSLNANANLLDRNPKRRSLGDHASPSLGRLVAGRSVEWGSAGIGVVVSLLEAHEVQELQLTDEAILCGKANIGFESFPVADRSVPLSMSKTAALVQLLVDYMRAGSSVAIHCRMGIGRSALLAACVLVREGIKASAAFDLISAARGLRVPDTDVQVQWLREFDQETQRR
ncbi:MAG: protein tyrosine phosphatase [Alphaproteobacteria bacterium]|nr:protein tyrosine phosphatase [Alphaproteobacteria bacterium]